MLQLIPKAVLMKQTKKLLNESSYYFQIWKDKSHGITLNRILEETN